MSEDQLTYWGRRMSTAEWDSPEYREAEGNYAAALAAANARAQGRRMILKTFWVWHKDEDGPDPEAAWPEWTVADNPDGWEQAKQDVRDRYGDSLHSEREIDIGLDYDAVVKCWEPDMIDGDVR